MATGGAESGGRLGWQEGEVGYHAEESDDQELVAHPGTYRKEHLRGRVTAKYLQHQFEVVDACREWLAEHNNEALLAHMKEEEAAGGAK